MNPVNHFEIPYDDKERAQKFYTEVFGWTMQEHPMPDGHEYTMVYTGEIDENYMCKEKNVINGGLFKRNDHASSAPVIVITVPNLDAHLKIIAEHGGTKIMGPHKVGEIGLYAQVKDTEGNVIGVWEKLTPQ